jgi:inward rectifier potassium channel
MAKIRPVPPVPRIRRSRGNKIHIRQRDGKFEIQGAGVWHAYWRDPYHLLLTIPWTGFYALVAVGYVAINAFFAGLYLLRPGCLTGARSGSFEDAFFFSVHTLASIGYGVIAPKTTYANSLATLEAIVSLLLIAIVTGLSFARFSKPTARVLFSENLVITSHNGVPTLMFRAANQRRNLILEAQVRVYFSRDEISDEGMSFRRVYDLKLVRDINPSFLLTWNVMHPIDASSPLYGMTPETWPIGAPQLIVSLMGIDETVSYNIQVRHIYAMKDLRWNHRFADVVHVAADGDRYLDYDYFHQTIALEEP